MEASRERSGSKLLDISVIGKITGRMDLEFNSTKMETSMKECGKETKDTDKELTGETKLES